MHVYKQLGLDKDKLHRTHRLVGMCCGRGPRSLYEMNCAFTDCA